MQRLRQPLANLGFDYIRFRFGLRTALAACLSLIIAWALGLEHPQWSAMTVWAVSQPTRGLLLEKGAYRALGTLIGTLFGIILVVSADHQILPVAIGLTLWVALCVYIGNLIHGLVSYGTILAGYSASMVALLTRSPDALLPLGIDRLLTVFVGVMMALIVGWLFTYKRAEQSLINQMRRETIISLENVAQSISKQDKTLLNFDDRLSKLAQIEAQLLEHGTGSPAAHESARLVRKVINSQLEWLAHVYFQPIERNQEVSEHLLDAANLLRQNARRTDILNALKEAAIGIEQSQLRVAFNEFVDACDERLSFRDSGRAASSTRRSLSLLHRDWIGAREASIRTIVIMGLISLLWWYTEWFQVAFLLLGASIMLTLFSTTDNPAKTMKTVFVGQCAGALLSVIMHAAVWPYLNTTGAMVASLIPIMFIAALPLSHHRTINGSMDFVLVFLLLMQPVVPYSFDLFNSFSIALAVVLAPIIAMLGYKLLYPTNLARREHALSIAIADELDAHSRAPLSASRQRRYRARFYHRLFKLIQIADKTHASYQSVINWLHRYQQIMVSHERSMDKNLPR
ncbi:putative membrane protein YccC [Idiomarina fontislapidosi]|uniref:FUSC family protein n=1 Tax=Idiomarina fontislapidosi TaxID=263723 RepID=UPI000D8A02C8|nr:FUSC family protein [Idiomarina fontislapidosi]PYE30572.1 putative membrane protein YccC [Idiomarina fontislapidosi]